MFALPHKLRKTVLVKRSSKADATMALTSQFGAMNKFTPSYRNDSAKRNHRTFRNQRDYRSFCDYRKTGRPAVTNYGAAEMVALLSLATQLTVGVCYALLLTQMPTFSHAHPRLTLAIEFLVPLFLAISVVLLLKLNLGWMRRGQLRRPDLKLTGYLDHSFEKSYPIFADEAWNTVVDSMRSYTVKTPDTRLACWELKALHENDKCAKFTLQYVRTPLGTKPWRLYPRTIDCTIRLLGTGISTIVDVNYHANSSMDYAVVREIIEKTNEHIERSLTEVSCVYELQSLRSRLAL